MTRSGATVTMPARDTVTGIAVRHEIGDAPTSRFDGELHATERDSAAHPEVGTEEQLQPGDEDLVQRARHLGLLQHAVDESRASRPRRAPPTRPWSRRGFRASERKVAPGACEARHEQRTCRAACQTIAMGCEREGVSQATAWLSLDTRAIPTPPPPSLHALAHSSSTETPALSSRCPRRKVCWEGVP